MKIYFAHPCFTDRQKRFKKVFLGRFSDALSHNTEITIIDPFEYTPNIEADTKIKLKMAAIVKNECIRLLEEADIIIALMDDSDTGTAFEAGYAHALNKPLILISRGDCSGANAMLIGAAGNMFDNILEEEQFRKFKDFIIRLLEGGETLP